MMKDSKGEDIQIGDLIAYSEGYTCAVLTGTVVGFTKQMVKLETMTYKDIINKSPGNLLIVKR